MSTKVARLADVPHDRAMAVADGRVVLVRSGGKRGEGDRVLAFENRCLHADQPLDGGVVSNGVLMCPHHFWRYDVSTGLLTSSGIATSEQPLASIPVEIVGDEVVVEMPPIEPVRSTREILLDHARSWTRDGPDGSEPT